MESIDLTPIIQAVVALLAAITSVFVIPWIKGKVGEQRMEEFLRWVDIAVAAAEQLYASTEGDKKKDYVINFLRGKGLTFSEEDVDNAIEAAVNKLHNELYGQTSREEA